MKSVLISIRPQWCEKIVNRQKTIEVRKSAPKETPFKVYIYETKGATETPWVDEDGHYIYKGKGQVIGEFICDKVDEYAYDYCDGVDIDDDTILDTAIDREDINIYAKGKTLYGWHISDLKVYDKPKELSEFRIPCKTSCRNCKKPLYYDCWREENGIKVVTRPPQSWCYVESEQ